MSRATYNFDIKGIDCANCAASIETAISKLEGISNVTLNFLKGSLVYDCDHDLGNEMEEKVRAVIAKEEPDAVLTSKGHSHHHDHDHESHEDHEHSHAACEENHDHCECGNQEDQDHHHDHDHDHDHEHHHCRCEGHEDAEHHHNAETATYKFELTGIDCANCAANLETEISKLEGISNVTLNFLKSSLVYDCDHDLGKEMEENVRAVIAKEEPDAVLTLKGHSHHHSHEHHEHESQEEEIHGNPACKLIIEDIDCADCASSLEQKIKELPGISNVRLSFLNSTLVFDCDDPEQMEKQIRDLVAREEPDAIVRSMESGKKKAAEEEDIDQHDRIMMIRLITGALLFLAGLFTTGTVQAVIEIAAYLILGYDVLVKAAKGIGRGQVFDEHFLMSIATLAAMYLNDFREAAGVMLFYQIGEYFQERAVASSRRSIGELMDIRPDYATVRAGDDWVKTDPETVKAGDVIRVIPGERIPLDGIIVSGASSLDTSSLTGESKPRDVETGDEVISGSVNSTGVLEIRVTKEYGESTVSRILDLVENQDSRKAEAENFITKFSRYYTPAVVFSAIAVAIIVSIVTGDVNTGIYRACTFLVISCPCALVISVPLSFFAGIGGLSRHGILVKGANLIEPLSKTKMAVMDKTGTLTQGVFKVSDVIETENREETLEDAAYAEASSTHPIAVGIMNAYGKKIDPDSLGEVTEIAGRGTRVLHAGDTILAGNYKLMQENGVECEEARNDGTIVYVAKNGIFEGCILLEDQLKEDAYDAVEKLHRMNVKSAVVSGDTRTIAEKAAAELKVDDVHGECMPEDKVNLVNEYRKQGVTVFVGDGVNDAPVLAAADIGMAMGALGSDAAIEAADVVIMDDKPSGIALSISAAKKILRVVNMNIYGAISVKILTLIFGALGIANMWWAIFADTGVAMLCVLNSMRLLNIKKQ